MLLILLGAPFVEFVSSLDLNTCGLIRLLQALLQDIFSCPFDFFIVRLP